MYAVIGSIELNEFCKARIENSLARCFELDCVKFFITFANHFRNLAHTEFRVHYLIAGLESLKIGLGTDTALILLGRTVVRTA